MSKDNEYLSDVTLELIKTIKKCPFCMNDLNEGLTHYVSESKDMNPQHKIVCTCGWISKGFNTLQDMVVWYNSRGNRKFTLPEVKVTPSKREIADQVF